MNVFSLALLALSLTLLPFSITFFFKDLIITFNFPLILFSSMQFDMSLIFDWMSLFFSSCVLMISSMISLYSLSYIPKNEFYRFILVLNSFVISMIILIFSNNVFFIMLGWDGLGLSSYILVIYYQNFKASESGALTILSNRMGDILILLSIGLLTFSGFWDLLMSKEFPLLILFLLMIAGFSKSAQAPFSAWLPAAMAAPTPISALVHSSTLVTAGVFLMIRIMDTNHPFSLSIMFVISSITLFFSGLSANWEQDLKKIIALSTLSQIAMMMFAVSINAFHIAFFHLITHAFFKSTMFLCAGAIIHNSNYQDMRSHGAAIMFFPSLMISMGITSGALMGLPFLAGFYSKDAIIEMLLSNHLNSFMMSVLIFSVGLTASYSSRLSMKSSNQFMKNNKDKFIFIDPMMFYSISILTPLSIISGAGLGWFTLPNQIFIIPSLFKISIILMITAGLVVGFTLSFKSKSFRVIGDSSISMWFLHSLTCSPSLNFLKLGAMMNYLDKTWTELSSAQGSFKIINLASSYPNFSSSLHLVTLTLFFSSPWIIISL